MGGQKTADNTCTLHLMCEPKRHKMRVLVSGLFWTCLKETHIFDDKPVWQRSLVNDLETSDGKSPTCYHLNTNTSILSCPYPKKCTHANTHKRMCTRTPGLCTYYGKHAPRTRQTGHPCLSVSCKPAKLCIWATCWGSRHSNTYHTKDINCECSDTTLTVIPSSSSHMVRYGLPSTFMASSLLVGCPSSRRITPISGFLVVSPR